MRKKYFMYYACWNRVYALTVQDLFMIHNFKFDIRRYPSEPTRDKPEWVIRSQIYYATPAQVHYDAQVLADLTGHICRIGVTRYPLEDITFRYEGEILNGGKNGVT